MALLRKHDHSRDIKHRADHRQAKVVDEVDDEKLHTSGEVVEVGGRKLLVTRPQAVEGGEHPTESVDAADDGNQLDESHDQDLVQPVRIPERPAERVADAFHRRLGRRRAENCDQHQDEPDQEDDRAGGSAHGAHDPAGHRGAASAQGLR